MISAMILILGEDLDIETKVANITHYKDFKHLIIDGQGNYKRYLQVFLFQSDG